MSQPFASGKFAWGLCDICGFRYKLNELKAVIQNKTKTGWKACCDCWTPDHPSYSLPDVMAAHGQDPEALRDPRPESNEDRVLAPGGHPDWLDLLTKGSV